MNTLNPMRLFRKTDIKPFHAAKGEIIHQFTGRLEKNGASQKHSLAIMTLLPGLASEAHCHNIAEESFYIVKGHGRFVVGEEEFDVGVGDCVFVEPGETHSLRNTGDENLECILATGPAWQPEDSVQKDNAAPLI